MGRLGLPQLVFILVAVLLVYAAFNRRGPS
jgi:hypothetical protein